MWSGTRFVELDELGFGDGREFSVTGNVHWAVTRDHVGRERQRVWAEIQHVSEWLAPSLDSPLFGAKLRSVLRLYGARIKKALIARAEDQWEREREERDSR